MQRWPHQCQKGREHGRQHLTASQPTVKGWHFTLNRYCPRGQELGIILTREGWWSGICLLPHLLSALSSTASAPRPAICYPHLHVFICSLASDILPTLACIYWGRSLCNHNSLYEGYTTQTGHEKRHDTHTDKYSLLSTVDKLVLIRSFKCTLYSLILPQDFCVLIKYLKQKQECCVSGEAHLSM